MLLHVELFQFKLGWVRLEKVGKAVDHMRPSQPPEYLTETQNF
jgi:hypothetical protein